MIDCTKKGYYMYNIKHENVYSDCMKFHDKYCTTIMLAML